MPPAAGDGDRSVEDDLSLPIHLADRLKSAADAAVSFRPDCSDLAVRADPLAAALRAALVSARYSPPLRRIAAAAHKALDRAHALVRRCHRRHNLLRRLLAAAFPPASPDDFRRAAALLDASIADLSWLLSLYADTAAAAAALSLPPIAATDPVLAYVWTCAAALHSASAARADAAHSLANLAFDSDRNRWVIVEEGAVPLLLALVKDDDDEDAQIAAALALSNLSADCQLVAALVSALAVPIVVQTLINSNSVRVQAQLALLIARMATVDPVAREAFGEQNAVRPLVSLLSSELPSSGVYQVGGGAARGQVKSKGSENSVDRNAVKVACARALWSLARGSNLNSRRITETKGLLVLSKLVETERDELQLNCLMTIMEIVAAAESDAELRSSAFKTKSPAAKSVVEQLLRVLQQESSWSLRVAAVKSIGSLARTFGARESPGYLKLLVQQLWELNVDVATEAVIALTKFASSENFLGAEHSKTIIEFDGVAPLIRLLRPGEKSQLPGLILLCYLAIHVPNTDAFEQSNVLMTLQSVSRTAVAQHASLKELLPEAIYQLQLYRPGPGEARIEIDGID